MDLGLKGKKAIITGGSKGIGLASAHALADEGADVAICSRNIDDVNSALEALKGKGVNAIGGAVDVADGDALKAFHQVSEFEGIIPALETAHAFAYLDELMKDFNSDSNIVVNVSGRGDKDINTVAEIDGIKF